MATRFTLRQTVGAHSAKPRSATRTQCRVLWRTQASVAGVIEARCIAIALGDRLRVDSYGARGQSIDGLGIFKLLKT